MTLGMYYVTFSFFKKIDNHKYWSTGVIVYFIIFRDDSSNQYEQLLLLGSCFIHNGRVSMSADIAKLLHINVTNDFSLQLLVTVYCFNITMAQIVAELL